MSASTGLKKFKCLLDMAACVGGETAVCAQKVEKFNQGLTDIFQDQVGGIGYPAWLFFGVIRNRVIAFLVKFSMGS